MHPLAINYIVFSIFLLFLLLINGGKIKGNKFDIVFIFISFIILAILHVFVDVNSVEDLPTYKWAYKTINVTEYPSFFNVLAKKDQLYAILNKIAATICEDFYFFLLLYNIFLLGTHYYIFKKYSPSIPISIIIFLVIFYNQSLFVIRQYIAISLLLWSIPFIINRRIIPFIILCILAFFNHTSAILFVPLYILYSIKSKTVFISIIIIAIIISTSISIDTIFALISSVGYDEYLDLNAEYNWTTKLIPIAYLVMYVLALKKQVLNDGINRLCFIGLFLYAMGYMFAPAVSLIVRILKYYELFIMFAVPITAKHIKIFSIRLIYLYSIIILQGYLTIRSLSEYYFASYKIMSINFLYLFILLIVDLFIVKIFINKRKSKTAMLTCSPKQSKF